MSIAQNLNSALRDRFQTISVNDNGVTRYASVYIPSGWTGTRSGDYACLAYPGNGSTTPADSTKDTPGRLLSNANANGKWNATIYKNNGDTAKVMIVSMPYVSGTGAWDAWSALWRKALVESGMSVADTTKLFTVNLSGGPDRFIDVKLQTADTANRFHRYVSKGVFMSPTGVGDAQLVLGNGKWVVAYNRLDPNASTSPSAAIALYNKIPSSSVKDSFSYAIANCHCATFWDSVMTTRNLLAPIGTSGPTVNLWRRMVDDTEMPTANAGNDFSVENTSTTLVGSGSDIDGTIVGYAWSKVSGTGGTISSPSSQSTSVSGLTVGTYIFRLTVTDSGGAQDTDDVVVTVTGEGTYIRVPKIRRGRKS